MQPSGRVARKERETGRRRRESGLVGARVRVPLFRLISAPLIRFRESGRDENDIITPHPNPEREKERDSPPTRSLSWPSRVREIRLFCTINNL